MINLTINILTLSKLRKSFSVILLFFFLFNIGGYYIWFSILKFNLQKEIRRDIRQGLSEKDLTLITLPLNDERGICWIKAGKEFTSNGRMYDVVKIKFFGNKKLIYCINDVKEKKLIADFSKTNESSQKAKKLLVNFLYIYIIPPESFLHINETSDYVYSLLPFNPKSITEDVTVPPPKFIFAA